MIGRQNMMKPIIIVLLLTPHIQPMKTVAVRCCLVAMEVLPVTTKTGSVTWCRTVKTEVMKLPGVHVRQSLTESVFVDQGTTSALTTHWSVQVVRPGINVRLAYHCQNIPRAWKI